MQTRAETYCKDHGHGPAMQLSALDVTSSYISFEITGPVITPVLRREQCNEGHKKCHLNNTKKKQIPQYTGQTRC